jgi:hypothetical protein
VVARLPRLLGVKRCRQSVLSGSSSSAERMVRYVVVGVGAIGGTVAVKLWATGCDVACCARGEHLSAIKADGLHLVTPDEDIVATIPAFTVRSIEPPLSASDVVIIATKAQAAEQVIVDLSTAVAAAGLGSPAIVCCTNGVSVERTALRHFDRVCESACCLSTLRFAKPSSCAHCHASVVYRCTRCRHGGNARYSPDSGDNLLPPICPPWLSPDWSLSSRFRPAVRVHRCCESP